MMKQIIYTIKSNNPIAGDIYQMELEGDSSAFTAPGQFANVLVDSRYLRRPISACDFSKDSLTLVYRVVGGGTKDLSELRAGGSVDALTGLGNGFDISGDFEKPMLVGGGMGAAPLYALAKALARKGRAPTVALGFADGDTAILLDDFRSLGCDVRVATLDGSLGSRGLVTDVMPRDFDAWFACGPEAMMRAAHEKCGDVAGQLSFEERMGCGFGACVGCTRRTKSGYKRVCADGPVFSSAEVIW